MKLRYVGRYEPVVVMVMQKDGTKGKSLESGEVFDCEPEEAADIMKRFNEKGQEKKFIGADEPWKNPRKAKAKAEPERNKMHKPSKEA